MPPLITSQIIAFENNREANAVFPTAKTSAKEIAEALKLPEYSSVLLLIGGADSVDEKLQARLTQLFGRGVARAAVTVKAVIVDGGTQAGVMALMGEAVAARGYKSSLVGVAPAGKVKFAGSTGTGDTPLESNHSHFVLVPAADWGGETNTIFSLVAELTNKKQPWVALIVGGGNVARREALEAVRQNLPLHVVAGSGGVADEIAAAFEAQPQLPEDPVLAEIVADGQIEIIQLSSPVKAAERLIVNTLDRESVLMQAWERFAIYDANASFQHNRFKRIQFTVLAIGLLATALAIIKQVFAPRDLAGNFATSWKGWWIFPYPFPTRNYYPWFGWWLTYYVLLAIPIVISILITAANKFKQGNKWLLLRSAGEAIKREIFKYRARVVEYSRSSTVSPDAMTAKTNATKPTPEQVLAQRVEEISRRVMQTEVNASSLLPYDKTTAFPPAINRHDDGFSLLNPDRYVQVRLDDQAGYYKREAIEMEWWLKLLQWSVYIIGGVGTFLAAINQQVWIALTTALAAATVTFLSYKQTEGNLIKYNRAASNLDNVKSWWSALPAEEQAKQTAVDTLVDQTERVLQAEVDGWVQQMQNALAELRKGQPQTTEDGLIITPDEAVGEQPTAKAKVAGGRTAAKSNGADAANKTAAAKLGNAAAADGTESAPLPADTDNASGTSAATGNAS